MFVCFCIKLEIYSSNGITVSYQKNLTSNKSGQNESNTKFFTSKVGVAPIFCYVFLLFWCNYFQLAPAALQTAIAVRLLQICLKKTMESEIAIWLFIAVFSLSMYSWGTLYIESLVGYPMWLLVDPTEWLATRESVGLNIPAFIWVFLIPVYLPLILLLSMFWFRPNGVRRSSVVLMFLMLLWVFIITALYFVPDIQLKLAEGYNAKLIKLLNKTDFPLRGIPDLVYFFTACYMFLSIDKIKADCK